MTHAEMNELYELYALGTLDDDLRAEIEQHLRDGCSYCSEHFLEACRLTTELAQFMERVQPPSGLRGRVIASVKDPHVRASWLFAVVGASAACVALLVFSLWSRSEIGAMRGQLSALRHERDELRRAVEILSKPETRTVEFGLAENVPHGRVLVNRTGGLVFVGSHLPALANDRTFELWLIPAAKGGAPQPAGLFRPNGAGDSVDVSSSPVNPLQTAAVAVTVEPAAGSSAPTTKPFLVVPLS